MRGHINLLYIFPQYQSHSCIYQGYTYYKYVLFFLKKSFFFQNKLRDANTQMGVEVVYYLCILIKRQTISPCYVHIMCYLRKIYQGNAAPEHLRLKRERDANKRFVRRQTLRFLLLFAYYIFHNNRTIHFFKAIFSLDMSFTIKGQNSLETYM